ncbi:MAG: RNA methyltransferase, partial [Chloroflexi bacterium]|nr:RNA methyltransferase [Chloroflexota bacterium]
MAMITSLANEKVKLVRALQSQRKTREKERRFVVEGVRLAEEAIRAKAKIDFVFYANRPDARVRAVLNGLRQLGASAEEVSPAVMAACSDTENAPGLLAVLPFPPPPSHIPLLTSFVLVLDRLADPGNLGAI